MKVKLSKTQWEEMGRKAGWRKKAQMVEDTQMPQGPEDVVPSKFLNCMLDISGSDNPQGFAQELRDLCVRYQVKLDIFNKTIDM